MLHFIHRNSDEPVFLLPALMIGEGHRDITLSRRNIAPADRPYICVVTIWDYWRLDPGKCADHGVDHFSTTISASILNDVRQGNALIVLDLCNEGPAFHKPYFDVLHGYLDRWGVSPRRVVMILQNRSIGKVYERIYRNSRSEFIRFESYDFYVKMMAYRFSDDEWRKAAIGFDDDKFEFQMLDRNQKTHIALCLNATPRQNRILAVAALRYFKLFDQCLVSFGGIKYPKGAREMEEIVMHADRSIDFFWLADEVREVCLLPRLNVDGFQETGNDLWDKINPRSYLSTFMSLVTETDFLDGDIDRVTEKTVKAFCMGHPTMVLGNPYSVQSMANWGFQTFDDIITREYDVILDPGQRFRAVFAEFVRQAEFIKAGGRRWLGSVGEVSIANLRHSRGQFLANYRSRCDTVLIRNLTSLLAER